MRADSITWAEQKKTGKWWEGKRLILRREVQTGTLVIPAYTFVKVTRKWKGLALVTDACGHCGVQVRIKECPFGYLKWPEQEASCSTH